MSLRHWYSPPFTPLNTNSCSHHWHAALYTPLNTHTSTRHCPSLSPLADRQTCSAVNKPLSVTAPFKARYIAVCTPLNTILNPLCPAISPMISEFLSSVTFWFIRLFFLLFAFELSARQFRQLSQLKHAAALSKYCLASCWYRIG
jgi:hypothetical protein